MSANDVALGIMALCAIGVVYEMVMIGRHLAKSPVASVASPLDSVELAKGVSEAVVAKLATPVTPDANQLAEAVAQKWLEFEQARSAAASQAAETDKFSALIQEVAKLSEMVAQNKKAPRRPTSRKGGKTVTQTTTVKEVLPVEEGGTRDEKTNLSA